MLTGKYASPRDVPAGSRAAGPRATVFARRHFSQDHFDRVDRLREIASQVGVPPARLALAWVLRRPEVSTAIVGASSVAQVEETAAAGEVDLDGTTLAMLDAQVRADHDPSGGRAGGGWLRRRRARS
jgi:aryl-alcohol dehydrogenase-like predicted oxidoreductase